MIHRICSKLGGCIECRFATVLQLVDGLLMGVNQTLKGARNLLFRFQYFPAYLIPFSHIILLGILSMKNTPTILSREIFS